MLTAVPVPPAVQLLLAVASRRAPPALLPGLVALLTPPGRKARAKGKSRWPGRPQRLRGLCLWHRTASPPFSRLVNVSKRRSLLQTQCCPRGSRRWPTFSRQLLLKPSGKETWSKTHRNVQGGPEKHLPLSWKHVAGSSAPSAVCWWHQAEWCS